MPKAASSSSTRRPNRPSACRATPSWARRWPISSSPAICAAGMPTGCATSSAAASTICWAAGWRSRRCAPTAASFRWNWRSTRSRRAARPSSPPSCATSPSAVRREAALRASQGDLAEKTRFLETVLDTVAQGVTVMDADLRMRLVNNRFLAMYGYPAELGKPGTPLASLIRTGSSRRNSGRMRPRSPTRSPTLWPLSGRRPISGWRKPAPTAASSRCSAGRWKAAAWSRPTATSPG